MNKKAITLSLIGLLLSSAVFVSYATAAGLKKVVAVSRFENKSSWGGGGKWDIGSGMADQLADALIQSKQFTVLERQTLGDTLKEQDMVASGRMRKSQSAQKGKLVSAQILIKGTITEFESNSKGSKSGISLPMGLSLGGSKKTAHVGLIIRMINTTTGEIIASERVEGKAKSGGFKLGGNLKGIGFGTDGFKKTPIGKATQITIDRAVAKIAKSLRALPFQANVIKVKGNTIYVSAGARTGATVGKVFTVLSRGEEMVDPVTGESLGMEETTIGQLKLFDVKEKYAKARPVGKLTGIKVGDMVRAR